MSLALRRTLLGTVLALVAAASVAAEPSPSAIDRLRTAVADHPDDPDLCWALVRKLADSGPAADAVVAIRRYVTDWPERRHGARVTIARKLLDRGALPEAAQLLDARITEAPEDPMARFYHGLVLRGLGRIEAANRELRLAGRLEPSLQSETLLARALGLFELGREAEAVDLLKTILEIDPTDDTALRARLLLRRREMLSLQKRWRFDAYAGVEWDDNVTLENEENQIVASRRDDFRTLWGAGISGRPWIGDKGAITLGWRYDQTLHHELERFDILANTLFVSGNHQLSDAWAARVDAYVTNTLQDLDVELVGGAIRPSLLRSFGPKWGTLRGFAQIEVAEYHDTTQISALERDGIAYQLGLEHFLPLPIPRSLVSFSFGWTRNETQAGTSGSTTGLDGDYDFDGFRTRAMAHLELPFALLLRANASYSHDRYHNNNSTHFFTNFPDQRKRRDDVWSGRVELSREIVAPVRLELYWRGAWRRSNVDPFDYDKHVVGALLRVVID
ncbi:MAG: hypothetical protein AAGC67_01280 [Myxococcota bacterium]